jgi:hypothetical protein
MQTETGTKDPIAQYWINILLSKACQMRSNQPNRSSKQIAEYLRKWFDEQPGDKKNPLLSVLGTSTSVILRNNYIGYTLQVLI